MQRAIDEIKEKLSKPIIHQIRCPGSGASDDKDGDRMDREKVIKAIDNCVHRGVCLNCEYEEHISCKTCLMSDALALLKEQEQTIEALKEKLRLLEYGDHDTLQPLLRPAT